MRLKLVSPSHDTLLGHIDVPDHWQNWLEKRGGMTTAVMPRMPLPKTPLPDYAVLIPAVEKITLVKAYHSRYPDAVYLYEGSIERLEGLPGCSFSPSMAYLRSQAE